MAALAGIIFDMDGVLTDSEPWILKAAQTHLQRRYGIDVPAEDFKEFVGAGDDAFVGGPARKHGVTPELPADKLATYDVYEEIIVGELQSFPGVIDFIKHARAAGLKTAVASAADLRKVRANLDAIGLGLDGFDCVVTGTDVENKKPAPDCFLKAAKGIDLAPSSCLVIEDALNGAKAAKAAGASCLGMCTSFSGDELLAAGADWVTPDLSSIPAAVSAALGLS